MTFGPSAHLLVRTPRRAVRTGPLAAAVAVALAGGLAAAWLAVAAAGPVHRAAAVPRVALVVDGSGRPQAALARARAAARRSGGAAAVRVPRRAAGAAADVRFFAAQGYTTVVAVGPVASVAARAAAPAYPRTRFSGRDRVPPAPR